MKEVIVSFGIVLAFLVSVEYIILKDFGWCELSVIFAALTVVAIVMGFVTLKMVMKP